MSAPPIEVRVDFPDPDEAWLADLVRRAGVAARIVGDEDPAPSGDGHPALVVLHEQIAVPDDWLARLAASVPEHLATASVSAVVVGERAPDVLTRASDRCAELGGAVALEAPAGPCVLHTAAGRRLGDRTGLSHVLSDRLVVGGGTEPGFAPGSPGEHAARWARRCAAGAPSVTIDARSLEGDGAGTQVHTLELVAALAATGAVRLRVVLPPRPAEWAAAALRALPGVELRSYEEVVDAGIKTDVVHRPYQVFTVHDLRLLERLGHRIVVTQQDQLLYRNPGYHASLEEWEAYRHTCRIALARAERTVFFSEHARREALRDELVDPARAVVVPIGVDHRATSVPSAAAPAGLDGLAGRPFLLLLGTDLLHKNRRFAVDLVCALRDEAGWDGGLVLAGPHAEHGADGLADAGGDVPVVTLGRVGAPERRWLMDRCAAVVFPSVEEGFGLMPFEAAEAGRPCLFAPVAAMAELLPAAAATLAPWEPGASARRAAALLEPGPERDAHIDALREAARAYRWAETARRLCGVYDDALRAPLRSASQIAAVEAARHHEYLEFRERLGEDALSLVGPQGALPPDVVRPLLGVASKPALRGPLFGVVKLLYRAGRGRSRQPVPPSETSQAPPTR